MVAEPVSTSELERLLGYSSEISGPFGPSRPAGSHELMREGEATATASAVAGLIDILKGSSSEGWASGEAKTMASPTREEIDAKLAASEARSETRSVQLESKFDLVLAKIAGLGEKMDDVRSDNRTTRSNIWAVCAVIVGVIVGTAALIMTLGPSAFTLGAQVRDMVQKELQLVAPAKIP